MGFPVYQPEEKKPSAFWRALDLLNRFNAGAQGSAIALLGGEGDPLTNYKKGFTGEEQYSGRDTLAQIGMDPDRFRTKAAGFALDALNPLDPLNYIGVGALTKAGKAAKLASKLDDVAGAAKAAGALRKVAPLADDWGEATKLGQRALVSFAGHRIPVPGDATVMRGLQKTGQAVKTSGFGRQMNRLFGGKRAGMADDVTYWGTQAGKAADEFKRQEEASLRAFQQSVAGEMDLLNRLGRKQRADLLELAERRNAGRIGAVEAANEAASKKMGPQWEALKQLRAKEAAFTQVLEKTGMGAFDDTVSEVGHMPHVLASLKDPGVSADTIDDFSWKPASELEDSIINRIFNQPSTMQRGYGVADEAIGNMASGQWDTVRKLNAATRANDLLGPRSPYLYSEDIVKVVNDRITQNVKNVNVDRFMEFLKSQGIAVDWNDAVHLPKADPVTGVMKSQFKKINQGRFAEKPVALPVDYEEAFRRYVKEVVSPENNYLALGGFAKELQSWWKSLALFSAPSAYMTRNAASGVVKNYLEGLTPFNPYTYQYYGEAGKVVTKYLTGRGNLNAIAGEITLPRSGVRVSLKRILQEYFARDFGGGGGFIGQEVLEKSARGELGEGVAGLMRTARQKNPWFKASLSVNEKVEMGLRLPLALKVMDDALVVAKKNKFAVPDMVHALEDVASAMPAYGGDAISAALDSAREIVHRTHFDYTDLSKFEQSAWLRGGLVPFYAWMRKNIPHEITNMLQQPGKYLPFARAYYNAWKTSGSKPEDAPFWLSENFAIPTTKDPEGRQSYLDMTNYLPMMDVANLVNAFKPWGTDPRRDYVERTSRWAANQLSPFVKAPFEQGLSKDFFSGREMKDMPAEAYGVQVPGGARTVHIANLIPTFGALDRLNPSVPGAKEGLWTKVGNITGQFTGDRRPHRNEPPGKQRWLRYFTGLTQYTPDPTALNMSLKARKRRYKEYINKAKRAKNEGLIGESRYYYELASKYKVD